MKRYAMALGFATVASALAMGASSCGSSPSTGGMVGDGGGGQGDSTTSGGDDSAAGDGASSGASGGGSGGASSGASGGGSNGASSGASGGGDGSCVPATACPSSYHCGRYVDPCTGKAFVCGSACTGGQICATSGASQSCQAQSCAGRCGVVGVDSCGVPMDCGGCSSGQACINNTCGPQVSVDAGGACGPLTCTPDSTTTLCGTVADSCGNTMRCSCPTGQQCSGGVCAAPPPECTTADGGALCGNVPNACGSGNIRCGSCPNGTQCSGGACVTCPAPSCGAATCGRAQNACGTSVTCGSPCPGTQVCMGGTCCTPSTCAAAMAAGLVTGCAPVSLGCGVEQECMFCDGGVCTGNTCGPCVPRTCADFGNAGCGHRVGCGSTQTLDCCPQGTTCMGDACCAPGQTNVNGICCSGGQVNYQGTCCTPGCTPGLPPGAQVSCGVTIYCQG